MRPLVLPWPDKVLSPNARTHWARKASVAKSHRTVARLTARSVAKTAGWAGLADDAALTVTISFQPPDNRRRDTDNMLASCKAYFDGVADALGVDDSRWTLRINRLPAKAPGAVTITIEV